MEPQPSKRRRLSHLTEGQQGREARMVDVGAKPSTARSAVARAVVRFPGDLLAQVMAGQGPKGPVTEVARVAAILAAKRTSEWIPMCHPLPLDVVEVTFEALDAAVLEIRCRTACTARTGVEMEALVGASTAALVIYDMTKALDPAISIERVELVSKDGGSHGPWRRT
jgi:cyclic pyranopterin monophosphate synthase